VRGTLPFGFFGFLDPGEIKTWYLFPEVNQTWLGFTQRGNKGLGLGEDFAYKLHHNLNRIFKNFGQEEITSGTHLEKLCLIEKGVCFLQIKIPHFCKIFSPGTGGEFF
jgi:hypothetical protein